MSYIKYGCVISSGNVVPSTQQYEVVCPPEENHKTLRDGDIVVMRDAPDDINYYLLRLHDMTLHFLRTAGGRYYVGLRRVFDPQIGNPK